MTRAGDTGTDDGESTERQDAPRHSSRAGDPHITAQQSDGSHTVFRESGDSGAWLATDCVVTIQR